MDFLSNVSSIEDRPTLFELIAQDQLRDLIQPAVRYVLVFYAQRYPRYLLRIANSSEELYAAIMALVEWHFLKEFKGTFTENFYGLERQRGNTLKRTLLAAPNAVEKVIRLRTRDRVLAVAAVVGIPYIKAKLDDYYTDRESSVYPTVNAAYYLTTLYFNLGYMFGHVNYHKPSLAFLRQQIRRLNYTPTKSVELPPDSSLSPLVLLRLLLPKGISALKYLLPLGIFFLKFLEWWGTSDVAAQLSRKTSVELPPPAQVGSIPDSKLCRLCGQPIVNPTAVQTGFVFCYVCIYKWVQSHAKCPVTNIKLLTGVDGLRRLIV